MRFAGDALNAILLIGYFAAAVWRAWENRRDHWTRGSWLGLATVVLAGVTLAGCGFGITLAVDNHEPWLGAPGSNTRGGWVLVTMGTLTGGLALAGAALGWAALGEPERQFPFIGSRIGSLPAGATSSPERLRRG
jgi:hypothetical protein